jgi:hypothetical protein
MAKTTSSDAAARRMRRIVDATEPKVRRQVERALKALQASIPEGVLEQILRSRDAFALYQIASSLPTKLRPAVETLRDTFAAGVRAGTVQVARNVSQTFRFDMTNPLATQAAREQAARLVTAVTDETRSAIRAVVARSFEEGIPPRDAARLIRPLIGLTERQATAVASHRRDLIESGSSRRAANASAKAYAEKLRGKRALLIARTETIAASTNGQLAAWDAAVKAGLLSSRSRKVWITADDDRRCRFCAAMDGKTALVGGAFQGGRFGVTQGPPLHPNCRCAVGIESVPVERVRRRTA